VTTTARRTNRGESAAVQVESLDWQQIGKELDAQGSAVLPGILSAEECAEIAGLYPTRRSSAAG
jgi:hypothetical protein